MSVLILVMVSVWKVPCDKYNIIYCPKGWAVFIITYRSLEVEDEAVYRTQMSQEEVVVLGARGLQGWCW